MSNVQASSTRHSQVTHEIILDSPAIPVRPGRTIGQASSSQYQQHHQDTFTSLAAHRHDEYVDELHEDLGRSVCELANNARMEPLFQNIAEAKFHCMMALSFHRPNLCLMNRLSSGAKAAEYCTRSLASSIEAIGVAPQFASFAAGMMINAAFQETIHGAIARVLSAFPTVQEAARRLMQRSQAAALHVERFRQWTGRCFPRNRRSTR